MPSHPLTRHNGAHRLSLIGSIGFALSVTTSYGQMIRQVPLPLEVPPVVGRSQLLRHKSAADVLHVSISLEPPSPAAIQSFADGVSDPNSPNYRKFISPAQFGQQFGQPSARFANIVSYFRSRGFDIVLASENRLNILAQCSVAEAEQTFGTTINQYKALRPEPGRPEFFAYSEPLKLPSTIAPYVQAVGGLENFTRPVPRALTVTQTRALYNAAPIYNNGMRGEGRTVAISNWDGFRLTNLAPFYRAYGLATPAGGVGSNVKVVAVGGGSGSGAPQGEGDLDIQMVLGMAPLSNFIVYDGGGDLVSVLTKEANDNAADIISESWGWNLTSADATAAHNLHLQMTAQGITYMAATGDYGTTLEPYSYPNYEPEVLQVGGTIATPDATGKRGTEVGWDGSGGGWSTNSASFNVRPSWQTGTGVPNINYRLNPDISLNASGNGTGAYEFFFNGSMTPDFSGTSFSSPVFAGMLATGQQKLIAMGGLPLDAQNHRRMGRIQNIVYSQNLRKDVYFDVVEGKNGTLPNGQASAAGPGWDFVTGLGVIDLDAFIKTQKIPVLVTSGPVAAAIYASQGQHANGSATMMARVDGAGFSLDSVPLRGYGAVAAATLTFSLPDPTAAMTGLKLSVTSSAPRQATSYVYAYNNRTRAYEVLNASSAQGGNATVTVNFRNFADYVDADGRVTVIVRDVYPTRIPGLSFTLKLDAATLEAAK